MFGFSIVKPSFSFTDVKTITIPAICSVNSGLFTTTEHFKALAKNDKRVKKGKKD